ncbi:MAG: glycosyltransferase [Patescibacteria group bacterium]|nr:glycosyltransferase [Patescibacteria group bacterium]
MKVAIVHDYIKEYGGAERVLEVLSEIFPEAPIYTAFYKKDSLCYRKFKNKKIIPSWAHYIPFFATKLHSPLRFLAPWIWGSFDFSDYDIVITSASWYVTKGIKKGSKTIEICYCHTPPRWLYGYKTSVEWQKFWPIKVYGTIIGHFMRMYDFNAAQKVNYFIANSEEVASRIKKFYRRDAVVINPPATLSLARRAGPPVEKDYYFIVSRIVGGKGLDLAVETALKLGFKLKIAGASAGYSSQYKNLLKNAKNNIDFLGFVTDEELVKLYTKAKAFLALATDEDFGITPVEAMSCGTPVIAYNGGGYKETVINGKTGVFFDEQTVDSLSSAIKKLEALRQVQGKKMSEDCIKQAQKFSKEEFKKKIVKFINSHL